MPLTYTLAWIASVVATQLYLNRAEASGYRGNGYRPYDCRFRKEFIKQAEEALEAAQLFKKECSNGQSNQYIGVKLLMALLWAQDQADYLLTKHCGDYSCHIMRGFSCTEYEANKRARDKYYAKLNDEINTIRNLLGTHHSPILAHQIGHFLWGAIEVPLPIATMAALTKISIRPQLDHKTFGTAFLFYGGYKFLQWAENNLRHPDKGLAAEEKYIKQQLFLRVHHPDEYDSVRAKQWGADLMLATCIAYGLFSQVEERVKRRA